MITIIAQYYSAQNHVGIKNTICHFDDHKESLQNVGLAITNVNPADFDAIGLGTLENVI
jgi:hypothetical protein